MEYKGKLYGKVGGKYIECTETVQQLESRIKELEQTIENMKAIAGEKIESVGSITYVDYPNDNISFKAETIKGEIIEACCVINKHDRLLLSNEDKAGFWIECKPDTLQVVTKKQVEYCLYCGKSSCNGSCF